MLGGSPAGAGLLATPSIPELASALTAVDADALVYLLPPAPSRAGQGIVVTSGGDVLALPLPLLTADLTGPLDDYAREHKPSEPPLDEAHLARMPRGEGIVLRRYIPARFWPSR